jgi:hypothetical protein
MTRSELEQLTDCGHDLAAKVALAIIAAANVGPCNMEMQVDMGTLGVIERTLGMFAIKGEPYLWKNCDRYEITLSFMEVDAVIYARVQR